jgi:hypothetical protein
MKSYWQFILELTAYQRMEKASWAKAAKRETKTVAKKRETLPWHAAGDRLHGWWHGTKTPIEFRWSYGAENHGVRFGGNFHATQMVKDPEAFGLTKAKIMQECNKLAKLRPDSVYIYRRDPVTGEIETRKRDGERIYHELLTGEKDQMGLLEALAFEKGWVKVSASNRSISLEGITKTVLKDVVREIREFGNDDPIVVLRYTQLSPADGYHDLKSTVLKTEQETEKFLNS